MTFCTGNPDHSVVARALKDLNKDIEFASRSTGYDFTSSEGMDLFQKNIVKHDVFINSSYIAPGVQLNLLEMACCAWMQADVKGHVISLGSTIEWTDSKDHQDYIQSKRNLRVRSLELNNETGITGVKTTHIIVGGINDGKPGHEFYLDAKEIALTIDWITKTPSRIALLQIESSNFKFDHLK